MKRYWLMLAALWLVLYCSFVLFTPPLLDGADSVRAESAREMLVTHDWVTPRANGALLMGDAPLGCWLMAASFRIFGVHDWAARIPTALAVLALGWTVFLLARRLREISLDPNLGGFYSVLILLTSFGPFFFTRILLPDILLCLWTTVALFFFVRTFGEDYFARGIDCFGFAVACALGVLSGGLIGVVFPVAIVVLYLWATRRLWHLVNLRPAQSVIVFLLVATPWHVLAAMRNPVIPSATAGGKVHGFLWNYFVQEQLFRYLSIHQPSGRVSLLLPLFWLLVLVWMLPWSAFLFTGLREKAAELRAFVKGWRDRPVMLEARTTLLLSIWVLVVLLFFTFAIRREINALAALPAVAIGIGLWLTREADEAESEALRESGRSVATVLLVAGVGIALTAVGMAWFGGRPAPGLDISNVVGTAHMRSQFFFGPLLDLDLRKMGAFRWPLLITALGLSVGTIGNWVFRQRGRPGTANIFLAGAAVTFLIAGHFALVSFSPILSSEILVEAIRPELEEADADGGSLVVINGDYEQASSMGFYLERPIHLLNSPALNSRSLDKKVAEIAETDSSLAAKWNGAQRIFVWTEPGKLSTALGELHVVAQSGGKQIVSNQANHGGASF